MYESNPYVSQLSDFNCQETFFFLHLELFFYHLSKMMYYMISNAIRIIFLKRRKINVAKKKEKYCTKFLPHLLHFKWFTYTPENLTSVYFKR